MLDQWRTRFPPPDGFEGDEDGCFGERDYSRELTVAETAELEGAPVEDPPELVERRAAAAIERDRWFGFATPEAQEEEEEEQDEAAEAEPASTVEDPAPEPETETQPPAPNSRALLPPAEPADPARRPARARGSPA